MKAVVPGANLNIHLHGLMLDGVCLRTDSRLNFVETETSTVKVLLMLLRRSITRQIKLLTRRGVLAEEEEGPPT